MIKLFWQPVIKKRYSISRTPNSTQFYLLFFINSTFMLLIIPLALSCKRLQPTAGPGSNLFFPFLIRRSSKKNDYQNLLYKKICLRKDPKISKGQLVVILFNILSFLSIFILIYLKLS